MADDVVVDIEEERKVMPDIYLTVYMNMLPEGWEAVAYADRTYSLVKSTKEEAKTAFLAMWNEEKGSNIQAENVDYVDPVQ